MKKYFLSIVLLLIISVSNVLSANTFIPNEISFGNTNSQSEESVMYKAGDKVNINLNFVESDFPEDKTSIEYGVARRVVSGMIVDFEPIQKLGSQKSLNKLEIKNIEVIIPNIFENYSTSTYTFYVRTTIENNPDQYNFIVSKNNFKITPDLTKDLIKIEAINFLQSNGDRYGLSTGPTIYDLSKFSYKGVSSSTSIEVSFRSNFDTVLNPNIKFKKLRSDIVLEDFKPEAINIKKGINRLIIPLPNFNYEPGVYMGTIFFDNKQLPDLDFQYITGGDMVTFGQVKSTKTVNDYVINFDIYGTPIDFNLDLELNGLEKIAPRDGFYKTEFVFKNKSNKDLYNISKDIDFSTTTYSLSIPNNIKGISSVYIKTFNKDGVVIYEGNKDLNLFEKKEGMSLFLIIILPIIAILILFLIILILKKRNIKLKNQNKVLLFLLILTSSLFFGHKVLAVISATDWAVPRELPYLVAINGDQYNYEFAGLNVTKLRFQEDIRTKPFSLNSDYTVMFRDSYAICTNEGSNLSIGFSTTSTADAQVKAVRVNYRWGVTGIDIVGGAGSNSEHKIYTLPYRQLNLGKLNPSVQNNLYVSHYRERSGGGKEAEDLYKIPLAYTAIPFSSSASNITSSDANINWSYSASTTPNDWDPSQASTTWQSFYQVTISELSTFSTSSLTTKTKKSGSVIDTTKSVRSVNFDSLKEDTVYYVKIQGGKRVSGFENLTPILTYSFKTSKRTGCTCNTARTSTCTDALGVTTVTPNADYCKLSAACSNAYLDDEGDVYFKVIINNLISRIPTVSVNGIPFITGQNPYYTPRVYNLYSYNQPFVSNTLQTANFIITDIVDGQNTNLVCTYDSRPQTPTTPEVIGSGPFISLAKTPSITMNKGGNCTLDWSITGMPANTSCNITSSNTSFSPVSIPLTIAGSSTSAYIAGPINSNTKFTISCSGINLATPVLKSTICRVNPEIIEN